MAVSSTQPPNGDETAAAHSPPAGPGASASGTRRTADTGDHPALAIHRMLTEEIAVVNERWRQLQRNCEVLLSMAAGPGVSTASETAEHPPQRLTGLSAVHQAVQVLVFQARDEILAFPPTPAHPDCAALTDRMLNQAAARPGVRIRAIYPESVYATAGFDESAPADAQGHPLPDGAPEEAGPEKPGAGLEDAVTGSAALDIETFEADSDSETEGAEPAGSGPVPVRAPYQLRIAPEGTEARIAPELPLCMLVVDGGVALVSDDPARGALLIRDASTVAALRALFESYWIQAKAPASDDESQECSPLDRAILRQLATGNKDDAVARLLGISVRTLRRRVADLMQRVEAQSRFELAIEVAARGWVSPATLRSARPGAVRDSAVRDSGAQNRAAPEPRPARDYPPEWDEPGVGARTLTRRR
ncbi:LuxR C-terminal-related transcriptional regulator [Actinospica robiniae]|uniref:LuxR C-terminal-related transcriptional regulator n=1 Tax=Actinospica robiniae TaxID=304901 RepID=UPI00041D3F58|nr:LuxR C-terminal-related transcriptional regulator [Actinospica robiniae]